MHGISLCLGKWSLNKYDLFCLLMVPFITMHSFSNG